VCLLFALRIARTQLVRFVRNKARAEALENYFVVEKRSEIIYEKLRTVWWLKKYLL